MGGRGSTRVTSLNGTSNSAVVRCELTTPAEKCDIFREELQVAKKSGLKGWVLPGGSRCSCCGGPIGEHRTGMWAAYLRDHASAMLTPPPSPPPPPLPSTSPEECDILWEELDIAECYELKGWVLPGSRCAKCHAPIIDHPALTSSRRVLPRSVCQKVVADGPLVRVPAASTSRTELAFSLARAKNIFVQKKLSRTRTSSNSSRSRTTQVVPARV